MENKKEFVICRTMFCPDCYNAGSPAVGDKFLLYGGTRQRDFVDIVQRSYAKNRGFTPHTVMFDGVVIDKPPFVGYIRLIINCGVCGYVFGRDIDPDTGEEFYKMLGAIKGKPKYIYVTPNEWIALKSKWKDTGYEL